MRNPYDYVMDLIVKHLVRIDDNLFHDFPNDFPNDKESV